MRKKKCILLFLFGWVTFSLLAAGSNLALAASEQQGFSSFDGSSCGGSTWSNSNNFFADDGSAANTTAAPTRCADLTGGGFSIPEGSTIDGIEVSVERRSAVSGFAVDRYLQLIKNGSASGDDKADTTTTYTSSYQTITYGSSSDLWGQSWSYADINASNFGVRFSANCYDLGCEFPVGIAVDFISVKVYYSEGGLPAFLPPFLDMFNCQSSFIYDIDNQVATSTSVCDDVTLASSTAPSIENGFTHGELIISVFVFLIFTLTAYVALHNWVVGIKIKR